MTETDQLAVLKKRLEKSLVGFSNDVLKQTEPLLEFKPERGIFPVPELLLYMFRDVLGWKSSGPFEKMRWSVRGSFKGNPLYFELRKFGLFIMMGSKEDGDKERLIGQLHSALKIVDGSLRLLIEEQIAKGDVVIPNRFHEFSKRYEFFRNHADDSFKKGELPLQKKERPNGEPKKSLAEALSEVNNARKETQRGFYYSTAMVDCYFSALEHRLVLLTAFQGSSLEENELRQLLNEKWDEKLRRVLGDNRELDDILGKMRRIKERIRNPFAHGGVENDGGSLFFHLPKVGNLPATLTKYHDSIRFNIIPIGQDSHADVCKVFDDLDALLRAGDLERPHILLESDVDPSFDSKTLNLYKRIVSGSREDFDAFIEHWRRSWEMHANMDY